MPVLDILAHADKILENPAWLMFGLTVFVGSLGLLALLIFYPFGRD